MSRPSASACPSPPSTSARALEVAKDLQIDGTVGRSNHETLFSVGLKQLF